MSFEVGPVKRADKNCPKRHEETFEQTKNTKTDARTNIQTNLSECRFLSVSRYSSRLNLIVRLAPSLSAAAVPLTSL